MNIGIVIRRFNTRGGTERRTAELVRGLLEEGHEVQLFAEAWEAELVEELACHRIHTIKAARWLKALSFAVLAARATRRCDLDLVHSQARTYADDLATLGGGCHADYLDHFLADRPALRQAWERNHPFNRVTRALEKAQYRRCARIILNSNLARQGLVRYFPWAEEKCRVIYNGVDTEFFHPDMRWRREFRSQLQAAEDTVVFLFVGSGFARKGLAEFLRGLSLTQQRQPRTKIMALVVGNGDFPFYRARAKELGIEQQAVFTGAVADTRQFYCAADVFVLPTKFDPYANSTNEALASGLPVITTRTNGAHEILSPREGYVIERADDTEAMAAAMTTLLNEELRRELSQNARRLALLHPWPKTARKTIELYEQVITERRTKHDR